MRLIFLLSVLFLSGCTVLLTAAPGLIEAGVKIYQTSKTYKRDFPTPTPKK